MSAILTLLVAILGGGFSGFLPFYITRWDAKKNKNKEVLEAIERLDDRIDSLNAEIDKQGAKQDEIYAISCRVRILRFCDEMRNHILHTKDSWDQVESDITNYELYCSTHPEFKNNQTELTVSYINNEYMERLEKNDFL